MITIFLGNVGSGKTACAVREMLDGGMKTFSNIRTKGIKNNTMINKSMIIDKKIISYKKDGQPVYEERLNVDFWKNQKGAVNVIIDEAHTLMNPRTSMSKKNRIVNEWLALIRRVLGSHAGEHGELILITQLSRRLDVVAREMGTKVVYHVCHYNKRCLKCGKTWEETSEWPEPVYRCPSCDGFRLKKTNFVVDVRKFENMGRYEQWKEFGVRTYYSRHLVTDIEKVFPMYDTLQWENLFD